MVLSYFYKHICHAYLPTGIYNDISETDREITPESLKGFLRRNNIPVNKCKIKIQTLSQFLYYTVIKFKEEEHLQATERLIAQHKELFPPWMAFPNIFYGVPRWNQGFEYDYCILHWIPYWKSLTDVEKEDYLNKYPYPLEWKDWFEESEPNF